MDGGRREGAAPGHFLAAAPSGPVFRRSSGSRRRGLRNRGRSGQGVQRCKTVADCLKYRNKIGVDVAIEALRDTLRQRKATVDEIHRFAKVCRVANVIRPYLESAV